MTIRKITRYLPDPVLNVVTLLPSIERRKMSITISAFYFILFLSYLLSLEAQYAERRREPNENERGTACAANNSPRETAGCNDDASSSTWMGKMDGWIDNVAARRLITMEHKYQRNVTARECQSQRSETS